LKDLSNNSYEENVNALVNPQKTKWMGDYLVRRFDQEASGMINAPGSARRWIYRMITSNTPLREKMTLFWHGIFATGVPKVINGRVLSDQIDMIRTVGMGRLDDILLQLAKDPAMLVWLDNQENHKNGINENWGRELLELFSMGVGNYSEDDVKECAKAFTGWTIGNSEYMMVRAKRDSDWPYGRIACHFKFDQNDRDSDEKRFLGNQGYLNGEDIIRLICKKESTARFISRHLYHFFVEDEVPVPSWQEVSPKNPNAIDFLTKVYFESDHNISSMLSALFTSGFFKSKALTYNKVKGPAEFAVGVLKLSKEFELPSRDMIPVYRQIGWMGQELNNPPSVEGWHEGLEWIDTGALIERVNFASERIGNPKSPGLNQLVIDIENYLEGDTDAARCLEACLLHMGALHVSEKTYGSLLEYMDHSPIDPQRIRDLLRLIASSKEYQLS
jgi:uncharacterized protein (DUF1800 family)